MTRNQEASVITIGCVMLTVYALGQETRQEWSIRTTGSADHVQLRVERSKPGESTSISRDVPRDRFRNLPANVLEHGGSANFEYVHDAGTLACKGVFTWGHGSGTYKFTPNPNFGAELKKLGYEAPEERDQFQMLMSDVSLDFARKVKETGLSASTRQLMDMVNHGVSLDYLKQVKQAGFKSLTVEDAIRMRDHGVDAAFLQDAAALGYDLNAQDAVRLRDHGVPMPFLAELKNSGYDLTVDRIVKLRDHGVDSGVFRDLNKGGLKPGADDLIRMRDHGVSTGYLKEISDAGYDLSMDDVVQLHNSGVPAEFLTEAKALGFPFSVRELIDLRNHGVNGAYLRRIRDSGWKNLSAHDIMKLKDHGVD